MRIIQISESRGWSGGCEQMFLLATRLHSFGHKVFVVCPPDSELARRFRQAGLNVRCLVMRQDYDLFAARELAKIVKEKNCDIIHANHPRAHAVSLLAKYIGAKAHLVVTRRVSFPVGTNFFSRVKYASKRIDRHIAVSKSVAGCLVKGGVAPERVSVIPSGIDLTRFYPREPAEGLRRSLGITNGMAVVGCIANLSEWKGQSKLVEAAKICIGEKLASRFLFVGSGTDSDEFKSLVNNNGLADYVTCAGFRTDVPDILSVLTVCVSPAVRGEGLAGVLREALCQNVPVIASDVGGNGELVINDKTGLLVPPGDPKALAQAIKRILNDTKSAAEMAAQGRKLVQERYDINIIARDIEKLYVQICN